jgi:hypothetical protein
MNRARVGRLLIEVLVSIYDEMQAEDHGLPLSAKGRLELEAAAPALVREFGPRALAKLDALSDEGVRRILRSRIEPAFRRSAAEAGDRPS